MLVIVVCLQAIAQSLHEQHPDLVELPVRTPHWAEEEDHNTHPYLHTTERCATLCVSIQNEAAGEAVDRHLCFQGQLRVHRTFAGVLAEYDFRQLGAVVTLLDDQVWVSKASLFALAAGVSVVTVSAYIGRFSQHTSRRVVHALYPANNGSSGSRMPSTGWYSSTVHQLHDVADPFQLVVAMAVGSRVAAVNTLLPYLAWAGGPRYAEEFCSMRIVV